MAAGFYFSFRYGIPRLVVTILIIALGVWFIRGPKKAKAEDIPPFTPPAPEPAPAEPVETVKAETAEQAPEQEAPHGDD